MRIVRLVSVVAVLFSGLLSGVVNAQCDGKTCKAPVRTVVAASATVVEGVVGVAASGVREVIHGVQHLADRNCCNSVPVQTCCPAVVQSPACYQSQPVSYTGTVSPSVASSTYSSGGIAQSKAQQQANEGRMRHVGGSFGAGRYEGVGFSTVSADDAIRRCCYYGQRTPVEIGVARGAKGWYATVIYR